MQVHHAHRRLASPTQRSRDCTQQALGRQEAPPSHQRTARALHPVKSRANSVGPSTPPPVLKPTRPAGISMDHFSTASGSPTDPLASVSQWYPSPELSSDTAEDRPPTGVAPRRQLKHGRCGSSSRSVRSPLTCAQTASRCLPQPSKAPTAPRPQKGYSQGYGPRSRRPWTATLLLLMEDSSGCRRISVFQRSVSAKLPMDFGSLRSTGAPTGL